MTTQPIYCNINLLKSNSRKSPELRIRSGFSTNITNIWKNINKMVLMKDITDANIELSNYSNFVYYSNKLPIFQKKLKPIISQSYLAKSESSHILEIILPNSDFKAVYD